MNESKPVDTPLITESKQRVIEFVIEQVECLIAYQTANFESNIDKTGNRCGIRNVAEFRGIYFVYE
jgi:hypothetical protein